MLPLLRGFVLSSSVAAKLPPMSFDRNLILHLAFPSGVAKKYVDIEYDLKPTHQRGSWTSKEVAHNLQCSKNTV
jgi:hypothetical protein